MTTTDWRPDDFRKFASDVERATKQLREAALQAVVPTASVLATMAKQWSIPRLQLQKAIDEAVGGPLRLETLIREMNPSIVSAQSVGALMQALMRRSGPQLGLPSAISRQFLL
jgi:ATP-dependent Zn protease